MSYAAQLAQLTDAIIDGDACMLPAIKPTRREAITPEVRLAVYADGYHARLLQAVLADYPTLAHYLGEATLTKAIHAYIRATPSRHWDLNQYPIGFAAFFAKGTADRAAASLALLEGAIAGVFWLPESEALDASALAVSPEMLEAARFTPRASLRLLTLQASANDYLQQFREHGTADMHDIPEYLALVRHHNEVQRTALEPAEHALLAALVAGAPFGEALERQQDAALAERLPLYLSRWLTGGFFRSLGER